MPKKYESFGVGKTPCMYKCIVGGGGGGGCWTSGRMDISFTVP